MQGKVNIIIAEHERSKPSRQEGSKDISEIIEMEESDNVDTERSKSITTSSSNSIDLEQQDLQLEPVYTRKATQKLRIDPLQLLDFAKDVDTIGDTPMLGLDDYSTTNSINAT